LSRCQPSLLNALVDILKDVRMGVQAKSDDKVAVV
jgi:hypothetical protein